jgi:Sulfotransferase domain
MLILCNGMLRSGSTWSFNVALKLLKSCDPARKVFGFYTENPAVLAAAARPRFSDLVIKSHYLDPTACAVLDTAKVIYTWRSPYDAVVSCMWMFGGTAEHWIDLVRKSLRLWASHRLQNNACIVSYEALVRDPLAVIERIGSYLGISLEPERVQKLGDELSLENLRRFSRHLAPSRLNHSGDYSYDRETLLHPNHIKNGGIGYGIRYLNDSQLSAIDAMLREEDFAFLCEPHGAVPEPEAGTLDPRFLRAAPP